MLIATSTGILLSLPFNCAQSELDDYLADPKSSRHTEQVFIVFNIFILVFFMTKLRMHCSQGEPMPAL